MEAPKIIVAFLAIALVCDYVLFDLGFTKGALDWIHRLIQPGVSLG